MQTDDRQHRSILQRIAHRVMRDRGLLPDFSSEAAAVKGLEENLHMQDRAAQSMKNLRHVHGVLSFETVEARPVFEGDEIRDLEVEKKPGNDELEDLAKHCAEEEDAANKVERQVGKSAAALLLESRNGEQFDAIVTGASSKGTWARLLTMPVEGRLVHGFESLDVGTLIRIELIFVDVDRGYIDFRKVGPSRH